MSVIDPVRDILCNDVWTLKGDQYVMRSDVRQKLYDEAIQTLKYAQYVKPEQWTHFYLLGSIATYNWSDDSDIDVTVLVDVDKYRQYESDGDDILDTVSSLLRSIGTKLFDTDHMVTYFVRADGKLSADAIYDITENKWVREPSSENESIDHELWEDAEHIAQRIDLKSGNLRRDLVDYNKLNKLVSTLTDDQLTEYKWRTLARESMVLADVIDLIDEYDDLHDKRRDVIESGELQPDELYDRHRSYLPDNIIYKILERYGYIQILLLIKKIERSRKINDNRFYNELMEIIGLNKTAKKYTQDDARADVRKYMKRLYGKGNDIYDAYIKQLTKRFGPVKGSK